MADYISREAAVSFFRKWANEIIEHEIETHSCDVRSMAQTLIDVADNLEDFPAADVEPVRPRGMMRYNKIFDWQQCSVCCAIIKSTQDIYVSEDYNLGGEINFCPRCGAKMDLEVEE